MRRRSITRSQGSPIQPHHSLMKKSADKRLLSWAKNRHNTKVPKRRLYASSPPIIQFDHTLRCPLISCSGQGHVNGLASSHITLSGCPFYHNTTPDKWSRMRAREQDDDSGEQQPGGNPFTVGQSSTKTSETDGGGILSSIGRLRTTICEPPLDDLVQSVELYQFRRAQQLLVSSSNPEQEALEQLILCARIQGQTEGHVVPGGHQSHPHHHHHPRHQHPASAASLPLQTVIFGQWQLQALHPSQYPLELACLPMLYVCEYCLTPMSNQVAFKRHAETCQWALPPGDEFYRKDNLSFFEVDGGQQVDYCQRLCLLTKLFLKHKTVHEADRVPAFHFYILVEYNDNGPHLVAFFSKQKAEDQDLPSTSSKNNSTTISSTSAASLSSPQIVYNNVSCILTMPHYQCQGYGRMLIEMSYVLSRTEQRVGSPERPLSDLGLMLYRKFWTYELLHYLSNYGKKTINLKTISQDLSFAITDIVSTLLDLKMLVYFRTQYYIVNRKTDIESRLAQLKPPSSNDRRRRIDVSCISWTRHQLSQMPPSSPFLPSATSSNNTPSSNSVS